MRTLAIDLGTRRVGFALSDASGKWSTPLAVSQITKPDQAAAEAIRIIEKEGVERIVVGLPVNMDDSIGPQARSTLAWGRDLAIKSNKPVLYVDERLSSFDAEQQLNDRRRQGEKLTHKRKKEQLDAIAAATFLQAFLDGKLPPIDESSLS